MENGSQSSAICRLRVVHLRQCSGSRRSRSVAGLTLAAISRRSRPAASRRVNIIAAILERPVIEKVSMPEPLYPRSRVD
jgi:hypothetical protein